LHFPEALPTILRFPAERLLCDKRVRPHRASMDLVCDQMAKLHHIDVANHNFLIERITGAPIKKSRFTSFLHPGETFLLLGVVQMLANLLLSDSVKHWSRHFESKRLCCHSQMRFQHLTDIHAARDTERIQHDFDRCSVRQEWHVFFRNDARNDTLIAVTACHLIADTQLALARDVNLYLLDNPRIDIISALDSIHRALAFELQLRELVFIRCDDLTDFITDWAWIDLDMIVNYRELSQQ